MAVRKALRERRQRITLRCPGHRLTTPTTRLAEGRSSRLPRISQRRHNIQLRKAIHMAVRAATRTRRPGPTDRLNGRPRVTPIMRRRPIRAPRRTLLAGWVPVPTAEAAGVLIRQARTTALAGATGRVQRTWPVATVLKARTRRRGPRAAAITRQAVAATTVEEAAGTPAAADIDNILRKRLQERRPTTAAFFLCVATCGAVTAGHRPWFQQLIIRV